jgi:hypothetical protein
VFSVKSFVEIVASAMKRVGTWIIEGANVASSQLQVTVATMPDQTLKTQLLDIPWPRDHFSKHFR